jgi:hypothetical protein
MWQPFCSKPPSFTIGAISMATYNLRINGFSRGADPVIRTNHCAMFCAMGWG